jgi:hypothetical protein
VVRGEGSTTGAASRWMMNCSRRGESPDDGISLPLLPSMLSCCDRLLSHVRCV